MTTTATVTQESGDARRASTHATDEARELAGSHILCEALVREGVELLYGYPGGAIMPFYDALPAYPRLHHVLVRHEQAAAHAADGYARATGKVGVCVATSGPGATNLVTGLATAYMDSTPVVAITGQVGRPFIGRDAFQETDVLGLTLPITKHNFLVRRVEELADVVHEAFQLARSGRPGPVLIDVPKDVQFAKTVYRPAASVRSIELYRATRVPQPAPEAIQQAARLIAQARRPVIMSGHGVILSNAYSELRALAEKTNIPVITTLLGLSAFPVDHPLFLGMPGMHGPAFVNRAIGITDLIIGVGLRFDDRVTGKVSEFAPQAQIIHIDIDPSELNKVKPAVVPILADAKAALAALAEAVEPGDHREWLSELRQWEAEEQERARRLSRPVPYPTPTDILDAIYEVTDGEAIVVSDVGQHQMWTARFYKWTRPNSHITSGGLGTMGFALPAAMGVKMGRPEATVWVVAGDGGFQMNIQELATLRDEGVEIKVAIMNNGYLGMVRQWQEFFHQRNYSETPISSPDYVKLAEAYGLTGMRVERREDVQAAVQKAMQTPGTVIIDFAIEAEANVYPMVPPGAAITDMIIESE
ncbi:MAG: biosynthetic-type acetolactate synthase large subunit [Thermogemmatispora sp.]|uniref:biosynthetic-type acetolactate synthase large subunit n=1 Tax=Thermogemmatispora sp. TaxID=1968838 RepID=UPI00261A4D87|nr:biosynthetic-type acetolactate synthase large subunit [Thermogemmatispora sp.]MBX5456231.1 biosynthetic-type acetolactate synthase large subunit [Thermogemmatispora sp.]